MTTVQTHTPEEGERPELKPGAAWMRGRIMPIGEASIPLNDWGLIHSDITYDVVPVWDGAFFRLGLYVDRFFRSMDRLRLDPGVSKADVKTVLNELVTANRSSAGLRGHGRIARGQYRPRLARPQRLPEPLLCLVRTLYPRHPAGYRGNRRVTACCKNRDPNFPLQCRPQGEELSLGGTSRRGSLRQRTLARKRSSCSTRQAT